jgi:hypothetical protein
MMRLTVLSAIRVNRSSNGRITEENALALRFNSGGSPARCVGDPTTAISQMIMPTTEKMRPRKWFGNWLRAAYLRVRQPLGFVLIILVTLGGLWNSKLQIGASAILLAMILRLMFEIHARSESAPSIQRVRSVADARTEIEKYLRDALRQDGFIRVQWIGMTMFNVWNTMEAVFDKLADEVRAKQVRFEVAMLDGTWLDQNRINSSWTGASADINAEKIRLYTQGDPLKLQGLDWVFEVHRYAHMPALHGGLINGKYLLMGLCRWEGRMLKAGDRPYDIFTFKDGDDSLDKIKVFENWFNLCFGPKPDWYSHLPDTERGSPRIAQ